MDESRWRAQERYYDELVNPDPTERGFKRNVGRYRAELHERFSSPLYPFVFVLIIVAYLGQAQSTRQNRVQATVGGFFVAAGFRLAGIATNNFVTLNAAAVPLLYAIPLAGIALGIYWLVRPPSPHRPRNRLARLNDLVFERLQAAWQARRGQAQLNLSEN
jgi:lipopolysaccharide export system permease protein